MHFLRIVSRTDSLGPRHKQESFVAMTISGFEALSIHRRSLKSNALCFAGFANFELMEMGAARQQLYPDPLEWLKPRWL